jgi:Arc/MetJ-type ribon-helix-helix transcriptional regulator
MENIMPTTRKYPVSIGFTYELLKKIDEKVESTGTKSRSEFVQKILLENLDEECVQCQMIEKLRVNNLLNLPFESMPMMAEVDHYIAERLEIRRIRRTTLEIIQNETDLEKILCKLEEIGIVRERGLMIIDNGLANGTFYENPKGIINLV